MTTPSGLPTGSERETVLNMLEAVGEYDPARYKGVSRAAILSSLCMTKGAVKILARRLRAALSVKRELVRPTVQECAAMVRSAIEIGNTTNVSPGEALRMMDAAWNWLAASPPEASEEPKCGATVTCGVEHDPCPLPVGCSIHTPVPPVEPEPVARFLRLIRMHSHEVPSDRITEHRVPAGTRLVGRLYIAPDGELVVTDGWPNDEVADDDPDVHNCDEMGCSTMSHVIARLASPVAPREPEK